MIDTRCLCLIGRVNLDSTTIVSYLGTSIAIISLSIHYIKFIREKASLKIHTHPEKEGFYYIDFPRSTTQNELGEFPIDYSKPSFVCCIYLEIVSDSSLPVTIYRIESKNKKSAHFALEEIPYMNMGKFTRGFRHLEKLNVPIKIEPYGTVCGYLFCPFTPLNDNPENEVIKLIFKSSRKTFKKTIKVNPHPDIQKQIDVIQYETY